MDEILRANSPTLTLKEWAAIAIVVSNRLHEECKRAFSPPS